ncbi:MAG TPA: heat-inducible transcriptional repressor HrcA [Chloroflexota bacterium]|jgi:heat-inducible transcriptional repressor|nr:heat-inducible transcriptional repressor HrcA [Chloroflexota bacterium]
MLTDRRRDILKLIVEDYIDSAIPVSSESIARRIAIPVSSATVRNEMAALEDEGFIAQPHTSAGRVPSDKGYRYFVEFLMPEKALTTEEQRMIDHQFYQVQLDTDQWVRLAAAVLARSAMNAAVITAPKVLDVKLKHIQLVQVQPRLALMVMVFDRGLLRQRFLNLEGDLTQDDLTRLANKINAELGSRNLRGVKRKLADFDGFDREVVDQLVAEMREVETPTPEQIVRDGLLNIMAQPEFAQTDKVRQFMAVFESGRLLEGVLTETLTSDGVRVIIGSENKSDDMRQCSIVLSRYGRDGEAEGVLGIVGPTRMSYSRVISSVRYTASILQDLIHAVYGGE